MKLLRRTGRALAVWVLVFSIGAAPLAEAEEPANRAVGHLDLAPFALVILPVDAEDVAPFMPAGFSAVAVNGKASLFLNIGVFANTEFEFDNGASLQDPAPYSYTELFVPAYGPNDSDEVGLVGLWRLASTPIFPVALARLGIDCGAGGGGQTSACHVRQVNVEAQTSPARSTLEAHVPWSYSPYEVAATFVPTALPWEAFAKLPVSAWHVGPRRLVREDIIWGTFPDMAIVGVGTGTVVVTDRGSPLSHMLGDPEDGRATGAAILLRGPVQGTFVAYAKAAP